MGKGEGWSRCGKLGNDVRKKVKEGHANAACLFVCLFVLVLLPISRNQLHKSDRTRMVDSQKTMG